MGGHKRPFPSFYQRLFPGNAFFSLQPITYSICFASSANSMPRKCLLPHCLDFRRVMGLLFGAFAKDLVPLCLSHCQPHSRAQLWYPHSSQTLGFLQRSSYSLISCTASVLLKVVPYTSFHCNFLHFFPFCSDYYKHFPTGPSLPLVFPALVHPPHRCLNYLLKAHIYLSSLLSGIKSYQCLPTTNRVRSELLSP